MRVAPASETASDPVARPDTTPDTGPGRAPERQTPPGDAARAGPEPGLEPDIEAPLDGGEVPDNAEATPVGAPVPRRELTPVERMIRGPRVRSL